MLWSKSIQAKENAEWSAWQLCQSGIPTERLSNANQYAHDLFWAEKHDLSCGVKQWLINVVRLAFLNA